MSKSVFLSSIKSILYPKTTINQWLRLLIIIGILLFIVILYNKRNQNKSQEGFQQNDNFLLKQNANIYDQFYSEKYDLLMKPDKSAVYEGELIIKMSIINYAFYYSKYY
jgi:hypothetical protein